MKDEKEIPYPEKKVYDLTCLLSWRFQLKINYFFLLVDQKSVYKVEKFLLKEPNSACKESKRCTDPDLKAAVCNYSACLTFAADVQRKPQIKDQVQMSLNVSLISKTTCHCGSWWAVTQSGRIVKTSAYSKDIWQNVYGVILTLSVVSYVLLFPPD